ncbi:regulatory factor, effector binding domain-containing protein [Haematococcus lacustris]
MHHAHHAMPYRAYVQAQSPEVDTHDLLATTKPSGHQAVQPAPPPVQQVASPEVFMMASTDQKAEFPPFNTVSRAKDYDLRLYGVYPVVEMAYDQRQEGYAALGSFIDGDNQEGVRFAFTQPVVMKYLSSTGQGKVMQMFIGSRKGAQPEGASPLSLAALPAPKDPAVKLSIAGGELLAVYRFEGYITPASAESARRQLLAALQRDGVQLSEEAAAGAFRVGQYGAVYQLGGRINELYLKVEPGRAGAAA